MYKGNYIISIIPARGASKGIPRKNIKQLCGKPLITYSIMQSLSSSYIDKTIVSTEDPEIAKLGEKYGAEVILRPQELASDVCPTEPVMIHVLSRLAEASIVPEYVVLLQPTSPIRRPEDIDEAIKLLIDNEGDSLLSVRENNSFFWSKEKKPLNYDYQKRPRRQDKQWEFIENGSIYITNRKILLQQKNRLGGRILTYVMPDWASFEIDTPFEFHLVQFIAKNVLPNSAKNIDKIKLVIFDVDGVFTDGSVYVDEHGQEILEFSKVDGKGIELLKDAGFQIAIISSEDSAVVEKRMKKLNIHRVYTGVNDKDRIYELLKKDLCLEDESIAYCGDDIGDLVPIRKAGFSSCPANAVDNIKLVCHYISPFRGGFGFVRDICDLLTKRVNCDSLC